MKQCIKCKQTKPFSEFHKRTTRKDGHQSYCKLCMNVAYNKSRLKRIDHYKAKHTSRRQQLYEVVDSWKSEQGCCICGEKDPAVLDLHHLDPNEKEFSPATLRSYSFKKFLKEAKKCVVICANDHRRLHKGTISLTDCSGVLKVDTETLNLPAVVRPHLPDPKNSPS